MKLDRNRTYLIITLIIAGISILLLGMSLRTLPPRDDDALMALWSYFFSGTGTREMFGAAGTADMPYGDWIVNFVRTVYFIALISFPVSIALAMVDKTLRKRIIRATIVLAVLIAALAFFYKQPQETVEDTDYPIGTLVPPEEEFVFDDSAFDYVGEDSPDWIVWIATAIIAIGLSVGIIVTVRYLQKRNQLTLDVDELAQPVIDAMNALELGADFDETVMKCYAGMMRTVEAYRGLRKGNTITASEFIESLIKAGLPKQAVLDLTRLFEGVRYGQHTTTPQDESRALNSLQLIATRLEEASHE